MLNDGRICAGKVLLESRTPSVETPYTAIGKAGHKWMELVASTGGMTVADDYLRSTPHWDLLHVPLLELVEWINTVELIPRRSVLEPEIAFDWAICDDWHATGTIDLLCLDEKTATVIDWKFYNDPGGLVAINRDMQMFAYAVGTFKRRPELERIVVHRVLCYYCMTHTIDLDRETLQLATEVVTEICQEIYDNRERFSVGAQCQSCFQSAVCDAYQGMGDQVTTKELAPYDGGDFNSEAEALAFLIAAPLVYKRLDDGYAAARRLIAQSGHPITDLVSKRQWGPRDSARDKIIDAAGCLAELAKVTSQERALAAADTSKAAMERSMKKARMRPRKRRAFFDHLRKLGMIEKEEIGQRYIWRRLRG